MGGHGLCRSLAEMKRKRQNNHWEQKRKAYSEFLIETTKEVINRKEFVSIWFCLLLRIKKPWKKLLLRIEKVLFFQWLQNTNKEEVALVDFLLFLYFNLYLMCWPQQHFGFFYFFFPNVNRCFEHRLRSRIKSLTNFFFSLNFFLLSSLIHVPNTD